MNKKAQEGILPTERPWKSIGFRKRWPLRGSDYDETAIRKIQEIDLALQLGKEEDHLLVPSTV
ncbi:MAG: hypothetical protein WC250_02305 [Candidatus Paceibacterota bacterium]